MSKININKAPFFKEALKKTSKKSKSKKEAIKKEKVVESQILPSGPEGPIELASEKYHFNPVTGKYVFFLKSVGKNVALDEATVKSIFVSYSDLFQEPATIEDVCRMLDWPRPCVEELIKIFQINHKSLPVTPLEYKTKTDDQILVDLEAQRKFSLHQKAEKQIWNSVQSKALKYEVLEHNILAPMERILDRWEPSPIKPLSQSKDYIYNDDILLISANDWHIASLTEGKTVYNGKDFNTEIVTESIYNYIEQIRERLANRKHVPSRCFILFNGDIIHSFSDNFTRRGTQLHCEYVNEDLFGIGLDLMIQFIVAVSSLFKQTEISIGAGNHEGHVALYLGMATQKALAHIKNINISIEQSWIFNKWLNNVYVLASHGAHSTMKGITVPRSGNKLQIFVQNHLLEKASEIAKSEQRILILGHYHSQYVEDFGSFTAIRCGSAVKSDGHGQALGFYNKPYQNCLLIGQNHVEELWNIYL